MNHGIKPDQGDHRRIERGGNPVNMESKYLQTYSFGATYATRAPSPRTFATQKNGRLLTIGTVFETNSKRNFGNLTNAKLQALSYFNAECSEPACASGKIVFTDHTKHSVRVFQTGKRNTTSVACGNGTAAGAVVLARGGKTTQFMVGCEQCFLAAEARIDRAERLFHVQQDWVLPRDWEFEEICLPDGWRALRVRGPLNHYLLIDAPADYDPRPGLAAALGDDSLAARAAVISRIAGRSRVRFYSLERAHGGAPQTGLITLALAVHQVQWVQDILPDFCVEHPLGCEPLPELQFRRQSILCRLPPVLVGLGSLNSEIEP
jgi:hypothetical protein